MITFGQQKSSCQQAWKNTQNTIGNPVKSYITNEHSFFTLSVYSNQGNISMKDFYMNQCKVKLPTISVPLDTYTFDPLLTDNPYPFCNNYASTKEFLGNFGTSQEGIFNNAYTDLFIYTPPCPNDLY